MSYEESILNQPIALLPLSIDLKAACELNNFRVLADLLPHYVDTLLALPGMNHRLWVEYVGFLEEHQLAHYLAETEPGE